MSDRDPAIVCPRCGADLESGPDSSSRLLLCLGCAAEYPVIAGIPDLRVFPDPYVDFDEDRAKARRLAERLDDLDFAEMVRFYYRSTPAVPAHHARLYTRGLLAAKARADAFLARLEPLTPGRRGAGDFLDLGCGTAPLLVAAAERGHRAVGVDIALRWLVLARKRLREHGLEAPLICACAEALPFAGASFERVGAESVLDQVRDQPAALAECRRVLRPGGRLLLSTPNRLSLGPDPQTGIWAGSWLPDRAVAAIVRRQGGIPPRRRLVSGRGLRRLLAAAGFERSPLVLPTVPTEQRRQLSPPLRAAATLYELVRATPGAGHLLRLIGPLLLTSAPKPTVADGTS